MKIANQKVSRGSRIVFVIMMTFMLVAGMLICDLPQAHAAAAPTAVARVTASKGTYLRLTAKMKGRKLNFAYRDAEVSVIAEEFTSKRSTSKKNRWYLVYYNGEYGYIRSDWLGKFTYAASQGVATGKVKYRAGAGNKMKKKGTLKRGKTVNVVLAATAKGSGETWYKIKKGKKYYYLSSKYVSITSAAASPVPASVPATFNVTELRCPESLNVGGKFTIKGKVTCNKTISIGTASVQNSSGKTVLSSQVAVNSTVFDILQADRNMKFGTLPAGNYTYRVDVIVDGRTYNQVSRGFVVKAPAPAAPAAPAAKPAATTQAAAPKPTTVKAGGVTFTVAELRCPESLYEGGAFTIKGKITASMPISKGVVRIRNASGQDIQRSEVTVNGGTFNILDADKNVRFGTLPAGNYTYFVDVYVNGIAYTQVSKAFNVYRASKAQRITNKAFELAWPAGTSSSKYSYNGGSPTAAYRLALENAYPNRSHWGAAAKVGASCDVFVGTTIRACGVDSKVPRGLKDQFPYYANSEKWTRVDYSGDKSVLRSGDVIMFTRNAGNTHTCLYLVKDGKEYIAEANFEHTYGTIVTSQKSIDNKLKLSDKKRMEIYRIVE